MSEKTTLVGAYPACGTIGNIGSLGAPIVHFCLMVVPGTHKVSGSVHITQAVQGGDYTGQVQGTIYQLLCGKHTQLVTLNGLVHPDGPVPIELPFEAHLKIDDAWNGVGGFSYANVHVENVPVEKSNCP